MRSGYVRIGPPPPEVEWTTTTDAPVGKYVYFVRREEKDGRVEYKVEKA